MKKIIFVVMALMIAYTTGFAQTKTPEAVKTAFIKRFPDATNVKWDKENAHEYEASFKNNGIKLSANFSDNGEWLETETGISFDKLPLKVQEAYNRDHKGTKVKAVSLIETSNGTMKYELEYKKGKKTIELFYDGTGNSVSE